MMKDNRGRKKGCTPWNKGLKGVQEGYWKGKKRSPESMRKMVETRKQNNNYSAWNQGKKLSKEEKKAYQEYWEKRKVRQGGQATQKARKTLTQHYGMKWEDMYLPEQPVIHHIDGNVENNLFLNLCVMSRGDHTRFHNSLGGIQND